MINLASKLVVVFLLLVSVTSWSQTQADPRVLVRQAGANTGQVLRWNGTNWAPASDKSMREESFTATAAQTTFTIAYSAPAVSGTAIPIRVYRNGVRLFYVPSGPTLSQFTYSGTTVTTAANVLNDIITIEYLN